MAFVEEFSSLYIVLEIYLACDARKVSGTTHQLVFAVPVNLGTIRGVLGGERICRAERAACRSIGQTTNEGFGAALLIGSARRRQKDLHLVGVPTADKAPCHSDGGIDVWAISRAFGGVGEYAYPRDLCVARRPCWRRCHRRDADE